MLNEKNGKNLLCWIRTLRSKIESDHNQSLPFMLMLRNMEGNNVTPINVGRNDVECFFSRKFSFTSCPTYRITNNVLKLSKTVRDVLEVENDDAKTYKEHLGRKNNMINEHEHVTEDIDFVLDINCDTEEGNFFKKHF